MINKDLTKSQENFCELVGLFGLLMAVASLFQHFYFMSGVWQEILLMIPFGLSIAAFILLMKKSWYTVPLTMISGFTVLVQILILAYFGVFILLPILLLAYLAITILLMHMDEVDKALRLKQAAEKAEAEEWVGKI